MQLVFKLFLASIAATWIFAISAYSDHTLAFGVRGNEAEVVAQCAKINGCSIPSEEVKEFEESGHTYVNIKDLLAGSEVMIMLPATLTPNQLMEALIKTRIARDQGARKITLVSKSPLSSTKVVGSNGEIKLALAELFAEAGAGHLKEADLPINALLAQKHPRAVVQNPDRMFVTGELHPEFRDQLAKELSLPVVATPKSSELKNARVLFVAPPSATKSVNENFFSTLAEIRRMVDAGAEVHLITPYQPYARLDKRDEGGLTDVTGRTAADLIATQRPASVAFARPHAPQSVGFYSTPVAQISGRETINSALKELGVEMVVSPDAGFQKDATLFAKDLGGLPVAVINKKRKPGSKETEIHGITSDVEIRGKVVVIVDDETASGGTLAKSAKYLKEVQGAAKVIAVVTHLAGSAKDALDSTHIDMMIATNTLPISTKPSDKFRVLSVVREFASGLKHLIPKMRSNSQKPLCVLEAITSVLRTPQLSE